MSIPRVVVSEKGRAQTFHSDMEGVEDTHNQEVL